MKIKFWVQPVKCNSYKVGLTYIIYTYKKEGEETRGEGEGRKK